MALYLADGIYRQRGALIPWIVSESGDRPDHEAAVYLYRRLASLEQTATS